MAINPPRPCLNVGGFTEDAGVGHEDWELWARAILKGYTLQVVPEALYWYRTASGRSGGGEYKTSHRRDARCLPASSRGRHYMASLMLLRVGRHVC